MSDASLSPVRPSKRIEFIDLLRGWAVIVMIETHVVNATLSPEVTASSFFQYVKFLNGLVAPSFLFASGLAYAVTARRKINDYLSFGPLLFKQLGRLVLILVIAYCLHLPKFSFSKLLHETTPHDWIVFFQADVLHCIAVSLLFIQGLLLLLKSERRLYLALTSVAIITVFVTPTMWGVDFLTVLPAVIAAYLNGLHFSLFPLFPWSAFLWGGAIVGYHYANARESAMRTNGPEEQHLMNRLALVGLGLIVFSVIIEPFVASMYPVYNYWMFSPSFFFLRFGIVVLLCVGMFLFEKRFRVSSASAVTLLGRESLLVYATHLLLIYGNFGKFNFKNEVNHTFGYAEAGVTTMVLILLMYLLAFGWSRIKRGPPRWKLVINLSTVFILLIVFFFGPGE